MDRPALIDPVAAAAPPERAETLTAAGALGIVLLVLVPRLAYLAADGPLFDGVYWAMADGLLQRGALAIQGTLTTEFEPLYPMFIAVLRRLVGDDPLRVQIAQVVVVSGGGIFVHRLATALTADRRVAAIAVVFFALDPMLVRQAGLHSESGLMSLVVVAFADAFARIRGAGSAARAGLALGIVTLTRTMTLPVVAGAACALVLRRKRGEAAVFTLCALALAGPLLARNHAVNGSWLPTRGGMALFVGNSPASASLLPEDDVDLLVPAAEAAVHGERPDLSPSSPEFARVANDILTGHALDYMSADWARTVRQKLRNVGYFFSLDLVPLRVIGDDTRLAGAHGNLVVENPRKRPTIEVLAYRLSYPPILALAIAGIWLRRRSLHQDLVLWILVATFAAIHAVYFPATRYRAPVSFVLFFYAAVTAASFLHRFERHEPCGASPHDPRRESAVSG